MRVVSQKKETCEREFFFDRVNLSYLKYLKFKFA